MTESIKDYYGKDEEGGRGKEKEKIQREVSPNLSVGFFLSFWSVKAACEFAFTTCTSFSTWTVWMTETFGDYVKDEGPRGKEIPRERVHSNDLTHIYVFVSFAFWSAEAACKFSLTQPCIFFSMNGLDE
jgi:hypothetical protein